MTPKSERAMKARLIEALARVASYAYSERFVLRVPRLDGIGPARSAEGAVLDQINRHGAIDALGANALP